MPVVGLRGQMPGVFIWFSCVADPLTLLSCVGDRAVLTLHQADRKLWLPLMAYVDPRMRQEKKMLSVLGDPPGREMVRL